MTFGDKGTRKDLILGDGLRLNALKCPEREALVYQDRRFSYRELNERVNRLANALIVRGFSKGDKIALLLHNCNENLEIFLGLAKTGIVSVPMTYRAIGKDLVYMINHSDAKGFIFGEEFEEIVQAIKPEIRGVREFWAVGRKNPPWAANYEDLLLSGSDLEPGVSVQETDPIWIAYTSGTTGVPKGVVGSHRGWVLQISLSAMELKIYEDDTFLNTGPLYHVAPYWSCLSILYLGGKVVVMREFDSVAALRLIEQEKITVASMVPTMFNRILNLPEKEKRKWDLRSLRVVKVGTAPLLTKTKEEILKFFSSAHLYEFYAATELGQVTILKPEDQMRKVRCCGKPFPGVEIKLLNDEGKEVTTGEVGELFMQGFNTFDEYYKNPEATKASRRGEWISVGDMARMDEEGYYYIVDRKKDMVISGGVNIYPVEIDEVIQKHPKVLEVAVVGVPDEVWGESLKAVVVLKETGGATEEEIRKFCEGKLAKYKIPRSVEFVSSLPKTPSGKIQKSIIRAQYWKDQEVKV
jgi:acyl-CoA synthetase (AMP-forming)/AMP-acid ligase II